MGCLSITISRVDRVKTFATLLRYPISIRTWNHYFAARATRVGEANATAELKAGLKVTCGLVCSIGTARYLRVEPKHIWLMPDNNFSADVVIVSNVHWRIE